MGTGECIKEHLDVLGDWRRPHFEMPIITVHGKQARILGFHEPSILSGALSSHFTVFGQYQQVYPFEMPGIV